MNHTGGGRARYCCPPHSHEISESCFSWRLCVTEESKGLPLGLEPLMKPYFWRFEPLVDTFKKSTPLNWRSNIKRAFLSGGWTAGPPMVCLAETPKLRESLFNITFRSAARHVVRENNRVTSGCKFRQKGH